MIAWVSCLHISQTENLDYIVMILNFLSDFTAVLMGGQGGYFTTL